MALTFPESPILNQVHQITGVFYQWNGTKWKRMDIYKSPSVSEYTNIIEQNAGSILIEPEKYNYYKINLNADFEISTSAGTPVIFESTQISSYANFVFTGSIASAYDSANQKIIVAYTDQINSDKGRVVVGTVSGTSITFGTPIDFDASAVSNISVTYDENAQKILIAYVNSTSNLRVIVGTVNGNTISFGTAYSGITENIGETALLYDSFSQKCILAYMDATNSLSKSAVGTISGTTVSFGTSATFESGVSDNLNLVYDTNADKSVIVYRFFNTLKSVVGTVSGTSISFGTPLSIDTQYTNYVTASYDKSSQKVVAVSARFTTVDEVIAVVGTVNGTTITFETPVQVVQSFNNFINAVYDESAQKTVILYSSGTFGNGSVVDGTISGSNISFGTAATFKSGGISSLSSVFDSTNNKIVTSYGDYTNSDYGTSVVITTATANVILPSSNIYNSFIMELNRDYTFPTYDLVNASYDNVSFNISSQDGFGHGIYIRSDGIKMYMVGLGNDRVYQYTLSTAWDLSTATYDSVNFSVGLEDSSPTDIFFKPDGTKMYMVGDLSNSVYQYTLSTPWVLSTASYDSISFDMTSQQGYPTGVFFKPDGTKMYMVGTNSARIFQYTLSSPWDLSTASYDSVNFSVGSQDNTPYEIYFNPDGTKVYMVGGGTDNVYQYTLSSPWDLSTVSYDSISFSVGSQDSFPTGIFFKSDGAKMYIVGLGNDNIYQYSTSGDIRSPTISWSNNIMWVGGNPPSINYDYDTTILLHFVTFDGVSWVAQQLSLDSRSS